MQEHLLEVPASGTSHQPAVRSVHASSEHFAGRNFTAALLSSFLSVTGGVALGSIIFPADAEHPNAEFQVAGMQIGLLCACVSSWIAYMKSDVHCGVPGGIFPPVIALGSTYFDSIGSEHPRTIMFALPLITLLQGLLLYGVARLPLERMVKGIPYTVFCGFLAGTGTVCIQGGLSMAAGGASLGSSAFWASPTLWGPPLLVAGAVYAAQQDESLPMTELLFPLSLLLLAVGFYLTLFAITGEIDLARARQDGYLYKFEVPTRPSFYHVWTLQSVADVQWARIFSQEFPLAFLNCFVLSLVTIVEDLYGVVEATGLQVDFKKELENTALMNVLSGLAGSMPTNLVMSYSVTASKNGATSRRFLLYLSIISSCFFLVADYILSLTPIMVTAAALIWVGIAMCWDMLWHGRRRLPRGDYLVIWLMVLVDVAKGPDLMLLVGLAVTSMQLAFRLSAIRVIDAEHTSRTERSSTLNALGRDAVLEADGERVLILHLARGPNSCDPGMEDRARPR